MTIRVEYRGERVSLSELSRRTGITDQAIYARYKAGARGEALVRPVKQYCADGTEPLLASERRPQHDPEFDVLLRRWHVLVAPWAVKAMR